MINKRKIGGSHEKQAADYLAAHGYEILEMNFFCRQGEIDIVAKDGKYLVFAEVKYRKDAGNGNPLMAVDARKRARISRTALYYLMKNRLPLETPVRFDAVGILENEITLVKNAFDFQGR